MSDLILPKRNAFLQANRANAYLVHQEAARDHEDARVDTSLAQGGTEDIDEEQEDFSVVAVSLKKPIEDKFKARLASAAPATSQIVLADLEFHSLGDDAPICQIYAVRLATDDHFNAYVMHKPLHADWSFLVRERGVELSPWDDPALAIPFARAIDLFVEFLKTNDVLVFKGTGSDFARLSAQMHRELDPAHTHFLLDELSKRGVRAMRVDKLIHSLCVECLPDSVKDRLFVDRRQTLLKLHVIWDALFWHPVLVYIDKEHPDRPDAVVDLKGARLPPLDVRPVQERTEFLTSKHLQPVWHTAHTDTLATRAILVFLLALAQHRSDLRAAVAGTGMTTLSLLSTYVVHQTKWFREQTLYPSPQAERVLGSIADEHAYLLADELDQAPPPPAGVSMARVAMFDNAPTVMRGRLKRTTMQQVTTWHDGQLVEVYKPIVRGQDVNKVRALKALVKAVDENASKSIFDRLEEAHGSMERIGLRPWYYYPNATGRTFPGYQVLHSRGCLDRRNGHEHGVEPDWDKDNIAFYDFDVLPRVAAYKLVFCKACKQYRDDSRARLLLALI